MGERSLWRAEKGDAGARATVREGLAEVESGPTYLGCGVEEKEAREEASERG